MARVPATIQPAEEPVARAKRTDRAVARRRYRAQLAEQEREQADELTEEAETTAPSPAARPGRTPAAPVAGPTQPTGIGSAFRAAFHQPRYRDDIAYLPRLVAHPSVWGPVLVMIATAAVFLATSGRELVSTLAIQYFVAPPPIGAIFIAGFFAPRASYLAGGIVGVVSAAVLGVMIALAPPSLVSPQPEASASPSPGASASAAATASGSPLASTVSSASPASSEASTPSPSAPASPGSSASSSISPEASPAPSPAPSQAPGTVIPTRMTADQAFVSALATSPLSGVFFGAAAAWYRRFLRLANPGRARPPARQSQRRRR
jgi:hypothetical protein